MEKANKYIYSLFSSMLQFTLLNFRMNLNASFVIPFLHNFIILPQIFQNSSLAKKASKDVLKDLVNSLITILLDNRLTSLEEGAQVIRTVNVMVVKIVEHADHTSVLR